jgi:hypothetical protein
MNFSDINWLASFVAFIAAFFASFFWFGPKTFYPIWWRAMGKNPEDVPGSSNMSMGVVFGLTALETFISAVVMTMVIAATGAAGSWIDGFRVGLIIGVAFAAAPSLGHRLFAQQGIKVWAIEVGSDVLNLALMGAIIAAMS